MLSNCSRKGTGYRLPLRRIIFDVDYKIFRHPAPYQLFCRDNLYGISKLNFVNAFFSPDDRLKCILRQLRGFAVRSQYHFRYCDAETGAMSAIYVWCRRVSALERTEYFFSNAWTEVFTVIFSIEKIQLSCRNSNTTSISVSRPIFYGVVDQICEDDPEQEAVSHDALVRDANHLQVPGLVTLLKAVVERQSNFVQKLKRLIPIKANVTVAYR